MKLSFLQNNSYTLLAVFFSLIFIFLTYSIRADDSVNVQLIVNGCNNNFICEPVIGEDVASCPNDCTVIPPSPTPTSTSNTSGKSGSKITKPVATIISQTVTDSTIKILWSSNVPVNASVTWTSESGQSGIIQEIGFVTEHSVFITNLDPETRYTITIEGTDLYQNNFFVRLQTSTQKISSTVSLVEDFEIYSQSEGAVLRWTNPLFDFQYVRILKSDEFFSQDPYDGEVIYEGSAQSFFDSEIQKDVRYYYTIFVKNSRGFSTGVAESFVYKSEQEFFEDVGQPITTFGPIYDSTFISNLDQSDLNAYIRFYQNNNELTQVNNTYAVENFKEVRVTVDAKNKFSPDTKMYISYFDRLETNRTKDYVFEYDVKQKLFTVQFLISNNEPTSPFIIYIRNNQETRGYLGYFSTLDIQNVPSGFIWKNILTNDLTSSIIFFIIVMIFLNFWWILLFWRRKKKEEEEEGEK